jgi:ribose transport system permease protein
MAPIPTSLSGLRMMVGNLGTAWLSDVISAAASAVLLVLLIVAFAATTPAFHIGSALAFVATTAWVYALPAAGLTLVMATGRMDLSGASVAALGAAIAAKLAVVGVPLLVGFVAAGIVATIVGAANGLLASISRQASFVLTLATAAICEAIAALVLGSRPVPLHTDDLGLTPLLVPGILLAVLGCALAVIALLSPGGAWLRRVGTMREGPKLVWLVVTLVVAYAASALLAAGGGVLELARTGAAFPGVSVQAELVVILVAILGGASLRGGRGAGYGAVVASLPAAALLYGLAVLPASGVGTLAVVAAAVVLAVLLDELRARLLPDRAPG